MKIEGIDVDSAIKSVKEQLKKERDLSRALKSYPLFLIKFKIRLLRSRVANLAKMAYDRTLELRQSDKE